MILAHRIQLDPTFKQAQYFARACGTSRFVWNWALEEWNRQYAAGEKPNGMKLKKEFNTVKYQLFPWMKSVHRDAHARPFDNLQSAFVNFFKKRAKRPKFKKKGVRDSFYAANDKLTLSGRSVRLPVVGKVRIREALRFDGKLMGATVSRSADRWFISVQVDVGDLQKARANDCVVGIDLGLSNSVTCSDGSVHQSPKALKKHLKRLRRLSREHSRKQKGSANKRKVSRRLAKLHWRIKCQRHDWLHKLTTHICRENQAVGIEDLAVKNMVKNRRLSCSIVDEAWYEFRRQLSYKAVLYGTDVVVAPRFYPSSKTCSNCGHVKAELSLAERTFACSACGFEIDRDLNAARNLASIATRSLRESDACGDRVRPARIGAVVVEAGTKPCTHVCTN